MFRAQNIQYEMAEKVRAVDCGALGAFHQLARNTGLIRAIDEKLHVLKRHLPYHESYFPHVANVIFWQFYEAVQLGARACASA
jgi:tryptophan synthase beta subunit